MPAPVIFHLFGCARQHLIPHRGIIGKCGQNHRSLHQVLRHQAIKHKNREVVGITPIVTWMTEEAMRGTRIVEREREDGISIALAELRVDVVVATWKELNWPDNERPFVLEDAKRSFSDNGQPPEVCAPK